MNLQCRLKVAVNTLIELLKHFSAFLPRLRFVTTNFMEELRVAIRLLHFAYISLRSFASTTPSFSDRTVVSGSGEMLRELSQERKAFSMSSREDAMRIFMLFNNCLLYTSDAADE
eukprot:TRINITY_DN9441_c0_g2_i1.p2 TRINITY_DN9441_c0_g2~~TRINITY_DN9441_c0_g2_i1.p2  ORF type:complete len:115 (+),score=14.99 TRINITY_DN9441_c0_g2_i1:266-610(+)